MVNLSYDCLQSIIVSYLKQIACKKSVTSGLNNPTGNENQAISEHGVEEIIWDFVERHEPNFPRACIHSKISW